MVLSCPFCFTSVCYDCQKHETYGNQYRAMFAENCTIEENKVLRQNHEQMSEESSRSTSKTEIGNEEGLEPSSEMEILFPVHCKYCNCQVGVYDFDSKIYHFYNVIPGMG